MLDIKITVLRITTYPDLISKLENPLLHACMMHEGEEFISIGGKKPKGFCDEAWKTIKPFVKKLASGEGNFYDGWMKDPYSALISCNDGFRPVSFYLEVKRGA